MTTIILQTAARGLTPVIMLISVWLLIRGHDAPGGGFIAALVAGAGVVLQYLANGLEGVRRFLPLHVNVLIGTGLLFGVGFGLLGLLLGGAFLEGAVWTIPLPVLGELKLATSLGFDVGVYLVVLAVMVTVVRYLGEEKP